MTEEIPVTGQRAVYVDRDGTIITDGHYVADPAKVRLIPGAARALRRLRDAGFALVLVTNQSGIGRGLYRLRDYRRVAKEVARQLSVRGVVMDGTYFCPDAPGLDPETTCRKPSPLMYQTAAKDLGLQLRGSYCVGDKESDLLPARVIGGTGILVRTGHGEEAARGLPRDFRVVDDLATAADLILRLEAD